MKPSLNDNLKLPQLTFTRFIAAMAIVIYHDKGLSYPFDGREIQNFVSFWNCMVSYFFVLSGFILVISSVKNGSVKVDKKAFWVNRFARIYPLYFFALIMYLILSLNANHKIESLTADKFSLTSLLIQSWFPSHAVDYNGPSWSLSVETLFYCSFPFLILLFERLRLSSKAILITGIWIISLSVYILFINQGYSYNFTHYFPPLHLNEFLLGMFTAYLFLDRAGIINKIKHYLLLSICVCAFIVLLLIFKHNRFLEAYYANGLFAPLFAMIILYLCTKTTSVRKYLGSKVAVYLGEISYGIYILQVPFSFVVYGINKRTLHLSHTKEFYIFLVGLIFFSALCYECIEKPLRKGIRKRFTVKRINKTLKAETLFIQENNVNSSIEIFSK